MSQMTHRTTFALDQRTAERLKHLAVTWQVSQAEVVRRAVALAEEQLGVDESPAASLRALHQAGSGLVREQAVQYLADLDDDRQLWRGE